MPPHTPSSVVPLLASPQHSSLRHSLQCSGPCEGEGVRSTSEGMGSEGEGGGVKVCRSEGVKILTRRYRAV